jgi:hypothetical protein
MRGVPLEPRRLYYGSPSERAGEKLLLEAGALTTYKLTRDV